MNNNAPLLSVILLSYYSKNKIETCYSKLNKLLNEENIPFEFIIIDDGSKDESFDIAVELEKQFNNIHAFQLSKNYTSHYAIFAGLSVCTGDCATVIPDDEQQPYNTIVEMYRLWEKGEKVIIPSREKREDSKINAMYSNLYYAIMNAISDIKYPKGGADAFFIDREIIDILNSKIHPINTLVTVEILRLGFSPYFLPFTRPIGLNKNKSRWTFRKKIKQASDAIYSSSSFPIKFITFLGTFFSLVSFLMILYYIVLYFVGVPASFGYIPRGWISTILVITFFSGLILLSLGIIAEYIWRIYEEVKGRPGYIIKKKQ